MTCFSNAKEGRLSYARNNHYKSLGSLKQFDSIKVQGKTCDCGKNNILYYNLGHNFWNKNEILP